MKYVCFCGYECTNGYPYKLHTINCQNYQNFKKIYLNIEELTDKLVNQRLTNHEVFDSYPYNIFIKSDIDNIKKLISYSPVRITKLGRRLTQNEIDSILNYDFLYQKYIVDDLPIVDICHLLNDEFDFSVIKNRLKKLKIPLKTLSEIHSSEKVLNKSKKTSLLKYGVESPMQLDSVKDKLKHTLLINYGVDHPSKSKVIRDKAIKTYQEKYCCDNPFKVESFKKKYRQTLMDRYGQSNPSLIQEFKDKKTETWISKYGVTHPMKVSEIKDKVKKSLFDHYGVYAPLQSQEIQEKVKETCIQRYGVSNPILNSDVKAKALKHMGENSCGYSKVSVSLFNDVSVRFDTNISELFNYSTHGKEIIVKDFDRNSCYCLDFAYSKDSIKLCIEFNGDFWHMNPKFHSSDEPAPFANERFSIAKDIWDFDDHRKQVIESQGFKVLTVWEYDYLHDKENTINKCVNFINECLNRT